MYTIFQWFVKITGWIPQLLVFRIKVYYEDKSVQDKRIRGKAIVISNHTKLFDFAHLMFVFWTRTLRCVAAEVLYAKNFLMQLFLKLMGMIRVDRDAHDFAFLSKCERILAKGGTVLIFPESRLPKPGEELPLEFKPSAVYLALETGAPIIPTYNNAEHFSRKHLRVIIGTPIDVRALYDDSLSEKQNIDRITQILRRKVIALGEELNRQTGSETGR